MFAFALDQSAHYPFLLGATNEKRQVNDFTLSKSRGHCVLPTYYIKVRGMSTDINFSEYPPSLIVGLMKLPGSQLWPGVIQLEEDEGKQ